jgi:hypothetical protein
VGRSRKFAWSTLSATEADKALRISYSESVREAFLDEEVADIELWVAVVVRVEKAPHARNCMSSNFS